MFYLTTLVLLHVFLEVFGGHNGKSNIVSLKSAGTNRNRGEMRFLLLTSRGWRLKLKLQAQERFPRMSGASDGMIVALLTGAVKKPWGYWMEIGLAVDMVFSVMLGNLQKFDVLKLCVPDYKVGTGINWAFEFLEEPTWVYLSFQCTAGSFPV